MSLLWSFLLGMVQGITEMLPVSSSAHLVLLPWFVEIKDQGLGFDVALHLGSLVAIIIAFRSDWAKIIKKGLLLFGQKMVPKNHDQKMVYYLLIATIPGALAGYFLEDLVSTVLRSPFIIVFTLVFYGILLMVMDKYGRKNKDFSKISLKDSIFIGAAQALALVPGTSRSGITITAGLYRGLKKEEAAKFSFMLSAPIVVGAGLIKVPSIPAVDLLSPAIWIGMISSLVFTFLAIKFVLGYVRKHSYNVFAYYRFFLAAVILAFIWMRQ